VLRLSNSDLNAGDRHPGTLIRIRIQYTACHGALPTLLTDALPPELSFVSAANGGIFADGGVTWSEASMGRRSGTVSFVALINPDVTPGTFVTNVVTLADTMGNSVTGANLIRTLVAHPQGPPAISLKASAPRTTPAGGSFRAMITYKNMDNGGSLAVVLSPGETFLLAIPPPASSSGGVLAWDGSALRLPNGSVSLRLQAAPLTPGTILTNTATLNMVGGQTQTVSVSTTLK